MGKTAKTMDAIKEVAGSETTTDNTMAFVNKTINNGEEVNPAPKKVEVEINSKKLKLNCRIIPDNSIANAYTNSFTVPVNEKDVKVFYCKGAVYLLPAYMLMASCNTPVSQCKVYLQ